MTISEIHKNYKSKKLTVSELVEEYIKRIELLDPVYNAFITVSPNEAKIRSKQLDKELSNANDLESLFKDKPLFGLPISHKDIISTKNIQTTAGSNILKGYVPPYNATVVEKYENAGAVILGKLNCDAFAHGASGENSDFGPTKNAYVLDRVAGGSSSGSGVSVASNMSVISSATDTGGSVRAPSSFNNTVGIKPTYGRVSRYGVIAMASSLDSIGHITNTVYDNALVLNITAGHDPKDASSSKTKTEDYTKLIGKSIKGIKVGLPKEYFSDNLDGEVRSEVNKSVELLKKAGAETIDVSLPHSELALAVYYVLVPSEISSNLGRFDGIRYGHTRDHFGEEAKRRIMMGTYTLSAGYYDAYYLKAQKVRTLIINDFQEAFKKVDVIFGPAMPILPPKLGENVDDPLKMYLMDILTCPINIAGLPALSVPAGFSKDGLPIGSQIIGNYFKEANLYQIGAYLENELKLYERRPEL